MGFLWGKISLKGRRKSMEDVLTIIPDFGEMLPPKLRPFKTFFGVFDGHNGRAAPNFCKDFIHVNTALYATQGHSLKDCFLHAHRRTQLHRAMRSGRQLGRLSRGALSSRALYDG